MFGSNQFILINHVYIVSIEMEHYQKNRDGWEKQTSQPETAIPV